jgi:hypothetical protein
MCTLETISCGIPAESILKVDPANDWRPRTAQTS